MSWRCQRPLEKTEQCKQSYNRWNRAAGLLHSILQCSSHVLITPTSSPAKVLGVGGGEDEDDDNEDDAEEVIQPSGWRNPWHPAVPAWRLESCWSGWVTPLTAAAGFGEGREQAEYYYQTPPV